MSQTLLPQLAAWADRWLGSALSQVFLLFLGLLLCLLVVAGLWERRLKSFGAVIGLALALLLALLALGESLAQGIGATDITTRLRLLAFLLGLAMLGMTLIAWRRAGLGRRQAIMWGATALLLVLSSLFARPFARFPSLLGMGYGAAVAGLLLLFLLLLAFHTSLLLAEYERVRRELELRLGRVEARLGLVPEAAADMAQPVEQLPIFRRLLDQLFHPAAIPRPPRRWRGTAAAVPAIILTAVLAVTTVGLLAPQVMIGDEVTHFYMLETQARHMPLPNFYAEIPMATGGVETRRYPHSFLWHYLGALVYGVTGGSFAAVQLYQALFLAQFLGAAYLLARGRGGVSTRSAMLYLLTLASLPMTLIFSVAFYQDVPMAAQVLTAFWLLQRRRWIWSTLFMALALWFKVNALLFYPVFVVYLVHLLWRGLGWRRAVAPAAAAIVLLVGSTWTLGWSIERHAGADFYPVIEARKLLRKIRTLSSPMSMHVPDLVSPAAAAEAGRPGPAGRLPSEQQAEIIANHPGDLRVPANWIVYGGLLLWLVAAAGLSQPLVRRHLPGGALEPGLAARQDWLWPLAIGGSYSLLAAWMLRTSPDARFFLPAVPFVWLPLCERVVRLPRIKPILALIASLAILQSGYVLHKTFRLRQVSPGLRSVIQYLGQHPPSPARVFMYPEGNYRLFPVTHEWYLSYRLRDFWHGNNDVRLLMLARHNVGAVVIKKHLIAPVDEAVTDLGVYPDSFVGQIAQDSRFRKVFENEAALVYQIEQGAASP